MVRKKTSIKEDTLMEVKNLAIFSCESSSYSSPALILNSPISLSSTSLHILSYVFSHPNCTAKDISKAINKDIYTTYYHLKKLKNLNLIEHNTSQLWEERKFKVRYSLLIFPLSSSFFPPSLPKSIGEEKIKEGMLLLGSPDFHGEFNLRARDHHLACTFVSNLTHKGWKINTRLDTDVKFEEIIQSENFFFVVGGPLTNMITYHLNPYLKVQFDKDSHFHGFYSLVSKRHFYEENISLIHRITLKKATFILLAGITLLSTSLALKAFFDFYDLLMSSPTSYVLLEGRDMDSDGYPERYEILEKSFSSL